MSIEEIEKMLKSCQSLSKTRNLNANDVVGVLELAMTVVRTLPKDLRVKAKLVYKPWSVPRAYHYRAEGTEMLCSFDENGDPVNLQIRRMIVGERELSRIIFTVKLTKDEKKELKALVGLTPQGFIPIVHNCIQ